MLSVILTATARFLLSLDTLIIGKLFSHVHNLKYVFIDQYHYKTQNSTFSSPFRVSKIIIIRRIFFFSCHSWNTSTLHFLGLIARVQHRKKISGGKNPILVLRKQKFDYRMKLGVSVFNSFLTFDIIFGM